MNFLMAVVLTSMLFMHGGEQLSYADKPVEIAGVVKDSAAQKAGIQPGDRVVSFGGIRNPTWDRINLELALTSPGHEQPVVVSRNGQELDLSVRSDPSPTNSVGYPPEPVLVGAISPNLPAEKAGLQEGDQVTAVGGQPLVSPYQFSDLVQQSTGRELDLQVLRDGKTVEVPIHPVWGDPGDGNPRWEIGIAFRFSTNLKKYSPPGALVKATEFHLVLADKLVYLVGQLFTGRVSIKQMQGPLGIVQESSKAAKRGFGDLISLMALVSLNLGILNLLPIPILDGGHILMLGVESVIRHDLSLKLKERVVTAGMVFLLLIFLIVMYNDVSRLIPGR
jgi:regulator of sigma E protease